MRRIRIAQIGAGHDHAADIITTLKMHSDVFELVGFAVVPEDAENSSAFRYEAKKEMYSGVTQLSVEDILNMDDLDAVCIETEDRALTKYAVMAAERGLNIHMDKPGGTDSEEYDRLIDLVKSRGLVFHVGYMYRYNSAIIKLKKDIAEGKLGDIISVEAQMNCLHNAEKREWLGNYPGGMLYFLGCHMIDLIYSIQGEPQEVIPLSAVSGLCGTCSEDFGMAAFRYKNGVSFAKSSAVENGGFERRQLVVCGTKGTVELRPLEVVDSSCVNTFVPIKTGVREIFDGASAPYETAPSGRYDAVMCAFADYITGKKVNPFGYEYERALHRLILRACGKDI